MVPAHPCQQGGSGQAHPNWTHRPGVGYCMASRCQEDQADVS